MKKFIAVFGAFVMLAGAVVPARVDAVAPTPQPNPCTPITVQLMDALDTAHQRTGDVFRFQTIGITVTPELVTVPRASTGYGIVTFASSAGAHGRSGSLIIESRYIAIPKHAPLQVAIDSNATSATANGSSGNLSGGVGLIPLPFVGTVVGAFNYLHAGKNAVVPAGTRFVVVPVGNLANKQRCSF